MCQMIRHILSVFSFLWFLGMSLKDLKEKKVSLCRLVVFAGISFVLFGLRISCASQTELSWICQDVLAGIIVGGVFLGISFLSRESIGYGDSWVIFLLGVQLGCEWLIELLWIAVAGLFFYAVWKWIKGEADKNTRIPFFPFLLAGYLFVEVKMF